MKMIFIPKYLIQAVLLFLICLLAGGVVWNVVVPSNDFFRTEPTMMEPLEVLLMGMSTDQRSKVN